MKYFFCLMIIVTLVGCSQSKTMEKKANIPYQTNPPPTTISTKENKPIKTNKTTRKNEVILNVPIIKQKPELKYGCEVTSLAMLLQYAGVNVNKMELARRIAKDNDPVKINKRGDITHWGNPSHGFVGDMTGKKRGYAVYATPTEQLMRQYLPERTLNLTGQSFDSLLNQVHHMKPVLVWTTGDFKSPDRWESWYHGNKKINTPLDLHAVVLVGYDKNYVYVNDPLTGNKTHRVEKQSFIKSWEALGKQALSYH